MTELLPPDAVSAADAIAAIERRYTPDEIANVVARYVAAIANGSDAAADGLSRFIAALPQDWRNDSEDSY